GAFHDRQSGLLTPLLAPDAVTAYADLVVEEAGRLRDSFREQVEVDVFQRVMDTTAAAMVRTLCPQAPAGDREALQEALAVSAASFWQLLVPFSSTLERLPLPATRRFLRARGQIDRFLASDIAAARRDPGRPGLLAAMLEASGGGEAMTDRQARDEAVNLFLAGRGTMATALTWSWYLLSQHPEEEGRLLAEVDEVAGDRPPAAPDLPQLRFTRSVLAESLRLYPPAWSLKRQAAADVPVGDYVV